MAPLPKVYNFMRGARCLRSSSSWAFLRPPSREKQVLLGAVAYDPAVSAIWERMRVYMLEVGVNFDFALFTNYEQQVGALLDGTIDIAWNGPVAHVLASRLAGSTSVVALGMRDVDRDFASLCVARRDANCDNVRGLEGLVVATGASDSPQSHIVPLQWLSDIGVHPAEILPFDLDLGKHGDTARGEVEALNAVMCGRADAALVSEMMWQRAMSNALPSIDGAALDANVAVIPGEGPPPFDNCQFDALATLPTWKTDAFTKALFAMDMANPEHAEAMELEMIEERWMPPREQGYALLERALEKRLASPGFK